MEVGQHGVNGLNVDVRADHQLDKSEQEVVQIQRH